jgi:hypothetical protein
MLQPTNPSRICKKCGTTLQRVGQFADQCVACLLELARDEEVLTAGAERFDHYQVVTHTDGTRVELGRGAMGVTLKAFDTMEPKEERKAFVRHLDSSQDFFAHWEKNGKGNFAAAFSDYHDLREFEELFREHFRNFLASQVKQEVEEKYLGRRVRRWKTCPFRGLHYFNFEHAPIFRGRTKAIREVLECLEAQVRAQRPFVLVTGASGSGKSSLVRAGVLPLLTLPETIEGVELWRWAVTQPGASGSGGDCFDALAAALLETPGLPALQDPESVNPIRDLTTERRQKADGIALRVRDALENTAREWKIQQSHSLKERESQLRESGRFENADLAQQQRRRLALPGARLALVVDQLEELFTTGFPPDVRQKYISTLASLIRSGRVSLLVTLRSDFYLRFQELPDLVELAKPSGKFDLLPPTPHELGEMIRLPAEAAGLRFEQEPATGQCLDQALCDAASATPESLPLLQHVLSLLYDLQDVRGDGLLRWSDYRELGELKGALAKHAEGVFSALPPDEQGAFPLDHEDIVPWAGFSPDGMRILTTSWDMTANLWDAATPFQLAQQVKEARDVTAREESSVSRSDLPTSQVEPLSIIASGLEFSPDGLLVPVNEEDRSRLAKQLKDLAQGVAPDARFIRWFFSARPKLALAAVDQALLVNPAALSAQALRLKVLARDARKRTDHP